MFDFGLKCLNYDKTKEIMPTCTSIPHDSLRRYSNNDSNNFK